MEESTEELEHALGTRWMVFERASKDFVGWVGAIPSSSGNEYDVGWRFRRDAWGNGFATEAARELIDRLFRHGAQRVFAQTMAVNSRSRAIMERLGLRLGRTFMLDVRTRCRAQNSARSSMSSSAPSGKLASAERTLGQLPMERVIIFGDALLGQGSAERPSGTTQFSGACPRGDDVCATGIMRRPRFGS